MQDYTTIKTANIVIRSSPLTDTSEASILPYQTPFSFAL